MILRDWFFYILLLICTSSMMYGVNVKKWYGWLQILLGFCLGFLMGSVNGNELSISTGIWFSILTGVFGWIRWLRRSEGG